MLLKSGGAEVESQGRGLTKSSPRDVNELNEALNKGSVKEKNEKWGRPREKKKKSDM